MQHVLDIKMFYKNNNCLVNSHITFNSTVYYTTALDGILPFINTLTTKSNPLFKDPVRTAQ